MMEATALGMIETIGLVSALEAEIHAQAWFRCRDCAASL